MKIDHNYPLEDFESQSYDRLQIDFQVSLVSNTTKNLVYSFYLFTNQYTTATTAKISQPLIISPFYIRYNYTIP